ncbi:MAG TPA: Calx-beta domain-containing protein [Pyrinomonadaceae bacterium]|nr:Calx-beta domain-containing protein [Pyrinomonadaceae bacterium]
MKNIQRRLTLLLLVSLVNLIASPFLPAAPLTAPDGPTEFIRRINLTTNDLVYSSTTGKIYASLPSAAGSGGNSIAAIDPTTGLITSTTFIGSEPNKLALSDDGHSLYVSLEGAFAIRRFDALTNTPGLQFSVGQDSFFGRYAISDLEVAPANPGTVAIARQIGLSPPEAGVAVFDNGVRRTNTGPGHSAGADFIAFSASASKLYGSATSGGIHTLNVDAAGVTLGSTVLASVFGDIKFSNGLIFTSGGHVINPDTNSLSGTFSNASSPAFQSAFVPDTAAGRAYYLTNGPTLGTFTLKAFDINTFLLLGSLEINGIEGAPTSLLRWGPNGLAFRTTNNQLFIIQTSLIPSAEPIPTPTPTSTPSPTPTPTPAAAAFIRQMPLTANDLVYNEGTQKIYASVPSSERSNGNTIAEIDPSLGTVTSQTFVGSEPTVLAQGDDGATLYVGLQGAASVRRYNILTHTAGQQFFIGRDSFHGTHDFSDIAVSPGNPSVVAIARIHRGTSPPEAGVAIFDNGVQRPQTGPGHSVGSQVLTFASPSVLYGDGDRGFASMLVDSSGVTVTGSGNFQAGNSIILANNLLYGSTGQVLDPGTGDLVGTFSGVGFISTSHVIDVPNNRAFFLVSQFLNGGGLNVQINAFDLSTFLPVGFLDIKGLAGSPGNLVRWGTNGLAFSTFDGKVYLIETALVNPGVPVASPTPTPSPTPSPTPPYIPTFLRRVDLPANSLVYSEATQALYATVPSTAGPNGNSITKITPASGEIGPSVFIGSEPGKMAISTDGQTIWTHLNGANAARRFDVLTGTPGVQFSTNLSQTPADMEVVPGSPQALVLSRGFNGGLAVFDNGVQRLNTANGFGGLIEFGANASTLYGTANGSLTKFLVDSTGVTQATVTGGVGGSGNTIKFSDGLLFWSSGLVADPESGDWKGTFQGAGFSSVMAVDGPNKRTFLASRSGTNVVILAFDSNTFTPVGAITLPEIAGEPVSLTRWGTNGLAFTTVPTTFPGASRVFLVQTELVSNAAPIPTGIQFETDRFFVFENSPTISIRVARTGDVSGTASINFATSDGTAKAGSDYTATSGTLTFGPGELSKNISIPIINDNLFETGDETFNLTLSDPTGAILTAPNVGTINIADNEFKPFVSTASAISITEGDSGTRNVAVNVTLSTPSVQVVTVDYATSNGTAAAGSDYVAASGTVTIPAGSSSATINISINGDTTVEANETFTVTLSNATNVAFLSNSIANVTIANDDATVQFNNAAFSVNEEAGFVNVTVTRVGDTSRPALVLSSTSDTAGLQSCTIANSKASERCDYATVAGRLQFGIGETTKTFTIPIVDDALVEGDETLTVNLSAVVGVNLGTQNAATITIVDNDTTPATQNPIDGVTPFITQQYIDFLGRLPDPIGLANWTATLAPCPNSGFGEFDHPECDRVHVSAGFFLSEEFRGRGYFAYKFYEVGFDRRPAYAEFVPDMALVGGAQSPELEIISKQVYMNSFVQRPEFKNRYDALSNSAFVDALELNAEVTLANKAALVAALDGNQKTRAEVLREIVELQSVTDKFFIRAFVAMQYFGYLRRDPDTIGYDNWVTTLTADPSNFRHMIFGFIYSDEYRHRFGP